jgi:hypothetical protein
VVAGLASLALVSGYLFMPEMRTGILISVALFAVSVAVVAALRARASARMILAIVVVLFVSGDLLYFRARGGYAMTVPESEALAPPAAVQYLKSQPGQFRVMSLVPLEGGWTRSEELRELVQPDLCTIWGIDSADFYASLMLKRQFAVHEGIVAELRRQPGSAAQLAGFLGALNVGYLIGPKDFDLTGWQQVFETPIARIWRNPSLLPRYFLVAETRPEDQAVQPAYEARARDRLERFSRMTAVWADHSVDAQILDHVLETPQDFRQVVTIAEPVSGLPLQMDRDASVRKVGTDSDTMMFDVESATPALLYVAESYYPGWRVTINGRSQPIVRANWLAMSVPVPAGRSHVEFRYVTPGYRAGLWITIVSVLALLTVWTVSTPRRSRPNRHDANRRTS